MSDSSRYRLPDERELQRAIGETKTERVADCPSEATLRRFVSGAYARDGQRLPALVEHLADCPDCEATLRRIRGEQSLRGNLQNAQVSRHSFLRASAYIVLSMMVLAAIWFGKIREPIPETVTIDLRLVTRGAEASALPAITLHRRLAQVRVVLPRNKPDGEYVLGIFRSPQDGPPLLTQAGSAVIQDDNTSVHASFSLEKLPSGTYFLGIREGPSPWSYYPFTLK